jgi:microcompartment protein CcmK/EutM
MNLGKVVGTVVSTRKEPVLDGIRFLLVRLVDVEGKETSGFVVAADAMGAGPGEMVLTAAGSSARQNDPDRQEARRQTSSWPSSRHLGSRRRNEVSQ